MQCRQVKAVDSFERFIVGQNVFKSIIENILIACKCRWVAPAPGVGLATHKPANAPIGEIRAKINPVAKPLQNVPFAIDTVEQTDTLEQINLSARYYFCNWISTQSISSRQENQVAVIIVGFAQRVFRQSTTVGVENFAVLQTINAQ